MVSGTYLNCSHETCATCPNSPPSTPPLLMTSSPIGFLAVVGMCQAPWPRDLCSGCSLCLACSLCRRWPLRCSNVTFWTSFSLTILFCNQGFTLVLYILCMHAKSLQSCLTVQPYGQQPTRLLCPRESLGKNIGVGCHFLLQINHGRPSSQTIPWFLTTSTINDCSETELTNECAGNQAES